MVKQVKKTLTHLVPSKEITYTELLRLLTEVASRINDRPIGVTRHSGAEPELLPITPNLMLYGSRAGDVDVMKADVEEDNKTLTRRDKYLEDVFANWWELWYSQVFSGLVPRRKWQNQHRNVMVGDICLLKFNKQLGKDAYRLCVVKEVEFDSKELVRTCHVGMRPRDAREATLPYKSKKLVIMKVPVQRLVVICPVDQIPEAEEFKMRNIAHKAVNQ